MPKQASGIFLIALGFFALFLLVSGRLSAVLAVIRDPRTAVPIDQSIANQTAAETQLAAEQQLVSADATANNAQAQLAQVQNAMATNAAALSQIHGSTIQPPAPVVAPSNIGTDPAALGAIGAAGAAFFNG